MEPIIIKDFNTGVAKSPLQGFANYRNVSASYSGGLEVNYKPLPEATPSVVTTFTADASTDVLTVANTLKYTFHTSLANSTGRAVTLTTTGTLPAGLSTSTTYFAIDVSSTTIKLATTLANALAGTAIDITSAGTGVHTLTSIDPGRILHWAYDSINTDYYGIDHTGHVWKKTSMNATPYLMAGNTLTSANGNGLSIWRNYLFAFRRSYIDVMKLSDGSWTNSWATISIDGTYYANHSAIVKDDRIFFCEGPYIGMIYEASGKTFDPSDSTTYTVNNTSLDFPSDETTTCLGELGKYLSVGTDFGKVYRWDWSSAATSWERPIQLRERNTHKMININGYLYIFYGNRGACAITNGTTTEEAFMISDYMSGFSSLKGVSIIIGGCDICNNKLIFSAYLSSGENGMAGIYSWDLTNKTLALENTIIADFAGGGSSQRVYAIISDGISYIYGASYDPDDTRYYIEYVSPAAYLHYDGNNAPTGKYSEAYFESGLYTIGDATNKSTASSLFLSLAKELGSAGIRIGYRYNLSENYTTLATIDSTSYSTSETDFKIPAGSIRGAKLQLKVEMKTALNSQTPFPPIISIKIV